MTGEPRNQVDSITMVTLTNAGRLSANAQSARKRLGFSPVAGSRCGIDPVNVTAMGTDSWFS